MLSAVQFYNKTCRICGMHNGVCADLLDRKNETYLDQIHKLLPVQIKSTDELPKNICHLCIATLNEFEYLKDRCDTVQSGLCITVEKLKYEKEKSENRSSEIPTDALLNRIDYLNPSDAKKDERSNEVHANREKCKKFVNSPTLLSEERNNNKNDVTKSVPTESDSESNNETDNCSNVTNKGKNDPTEVTKKTAEEKEENTSVSDFNYNPEDWEIQTIPGKNETTLYVCVKCRSILVRESAIQTHSCSVDAEEPENNDCNKTTRLRNTQEELNKKFEPLQRRINKIRHSDKKERKKKRIIKGCADD